EARPLRPPNAAIRVDRARGAPLWALSPVRDVIARSRAQRGGWDNSRWLATRHVGALVGLVLALLVLCDLPAVHDHGKAGLYNEDCPLARLAAGGPRACLSSSLDPTVLVRVPEELPVSPRAVPPQASLVSFDPRAPPSRSLLPSRALIG